MIGVFVQANECDTAAGCDALIARLHAAGVTDIFYNVHYKGAHYNSACIDPSSAMLAGFDSLAHLINIAHSLRMRVHAWICAGYDLLAAGGKQCDGVFWADFSDADTQMLMGELVHDISTNYDVQGVCLDYIRTPGMSNVDPQPFDADAVSDVIFMARDSLAGPLSACCKRRSWDDWGQDVSAWIGDCGLDLLLPMMYHPLNNPTDLPALLELVPRDQVIPLIAAIDTHQDGEPLKTPVEFDADLMYFEDAGFYDFAVFDQRATDEQLMMIAQEGEGMGAAEEHRILVNQVADCVTVATEAIANASAKLSEAASALQLLADFDTKLQQADAAAEQAATLAREAADAL